jgi:hypothetical protein
LLSGSRSSRPAEHERETGRTLGGRTGEVDHDGRGHGAWSDERNPACRVRREVLAARNTKPARRGQPGAQGVIGGSRSRTPTSSSTRRAREPTDPGMVFVLLGPPTRSGHQADQAGDRLSTARRKTKWWMGPDSIHLDGLGSPTPPAVSRSGNTGEALPRGLDQRAERRFRHQEGTANCPSAPRGPRHARGRTLASSRNSPAGKGQS